MGKEYLDISEIDDVKNISAEESALVRDRDIKIPITPLFCILTILTSVLISAGVYLIKNDIIFTAQTFLLVPLLIYVSAVDIKLHMAPNWISYIIFAIGIPNVVFDIVKSNYSDLLWNRVFGIFAGFILLFISAIVSKGGIGAADIKITTALGLSLGFSGIFTCLIVGILFAAIWGIVLMIRKKADKKTKLALLPYISAGAMVAMLLPNGIIF